MVARLRLFKSALNPRQAQLGRCYGVSVVGNSPSPEESLEASALTHASRRGLLARRSPLLKLQGDAKLIAMARGGNPAAFEMIVASSMEEPG